MLRSIVILAILLMTAVPAAAKAKKKPGDVWPKEKAATWYKEQPWFVGCNYIPSTAINQLEMWQKETWDPKTIDRELGWAADLGFTGVRVFLHDLPWKNDQSGFINRVDEFLRIADKHRIRVMFVLLDSCWHPEPKAGKQPAPMPHVHNSGWVQSPGVAVLKDAEKWKSMEEYVKGVIRPFQHDKRVLCWDLWNEPENNNASSYGKDDLKDKEKIVLPLVKQVFGWAREMSPTQPITAAPWQGDWADDKLSPLNRFLFESSDIITFHRYEDLPATKKVVEQLKRFERPILCTEFMARPMGSKFETHLPYFRDQKVGAFCWGFVAGKTQTIYPWDSWQKIYTGKPKVWFHDILRPDGKPYDADEVKKIKEQTSKRIDVRLRFSVEELDPSKPGDSFVECIVKNGGDQDIRVPTGYVGSYSKDAISLKSVGSRYHELTLVKWAASKEPELKLLKAGEEMVIFKDSLTKVLLLELMTNAPPKPKEERYYWSWMA